MARRLHVHIGTMKSGTSTIQTAFTANAAGLAAAGVWWVPADLRYESVRDLLDRPKQAPDHPSSALLHRGLQGSYDVAVLSNELLAGLPAAQVRRFVEAVAVDEVHVVVTARDLSRVIPSHWQETIKLGHTWSWTDFAAHVCSDETLAGDSAGAGQRDARRWFWRRHDIPRIIARWADVVPMEHITVVTVPPPPAPWEVTVERFASAVGVRTQGWAAAAEVSNPSLGAHSVELMRRVSAGMTTIEERDQDRRYRRALGRAMAAGSHHEPSFGLSVAQRDWVRERARAMVAEITASGVRLVGDVADLDPAPSGHAATVDPAESKDEDLLAAAIRGFDALLDDFVRLRAETEDLQRRLTLQEMARHDLESSNAMAKALQPESDPPQG